jgi:hypothetical protein
MVLAIQSKHTQSLSLENPQTSQIKASGTSFRSSLSTYYQPEVKKPSCWETVKIYAAKIWYYLSFQWLRDCCNGKTKREKLLSSMNSQISSFKETVEFEKGLKGKQKKLR